MKPRNRSHLAMLAGWLFADLFLVLLIVGLSMIPARSADEPTPPPPTSTSQPPPRPQGLDPVPVEFSIPLSPVDFRAGAVDSFLQLVDAELGRVNPDNRPVGFVLVFAYDTVSNTPRAMATARDAVGLLRSRSPAFASAPGVGYWTGERDKFEFMVFLMN